MLRGRSCLTPELFPIRRYAEFDDFEQVVRDPMRILEILNPEAMTHPRAHRPQDYPVFRHQRRRKHALGPSSS